MITDQVEESGLDTIRNKVPATLPTSDLAIGDLRCCDMIHRRIQYGCSRQKAIARLPPLAHVHFETL